MRSSRTGAATDAAGRESTEGGRLLRAALFAAQLEGGNETVDFRLPIAHRLEDQRCQQSAHVQMQPELRAPWGGSQGERASADEQPERQATRPLHAAGWLKSAHAQRHRSDCTIAEAHMRGDALAVSDAPLDPDDLGVPFPIPSAVGQDGPYRFG
jgi:hypothetical protein